MNCEIKWKSYETVHNMLEYNHKWIIQATLGLYLLNSKSCCFSAIVGRLEFYKLGRFISTLMAIAVRELFRDSGSIDLLTVNKKYN